MRGRPIKRTLRALHLDGVGHAPAGRLGGGLDAKTLVGTACQRTEGLTLVPVEAVPRALARRGVLAVPSSQRDACSLRSSSFANARP